MGQLIEEDAVPVLALNAQRLADFAEQHGRTDAMMARMMAVPQFCFFRDRC
jgi:hypothetical protein